jgi:hypothetical protein
MPECLPDLPRYIRQRGDEWQGANHQNGPWRPIPAPQSGLPWPIDGPAVPAGREPASVIEDPTDQEIEDWANASDDLPDVFLDPDSGRWERCFTSEEFCATVRAVLARWGR